MTEKSLRALISEANAEIRRLRNPDVSEATGRLDAIIKAAGLGSINKDALVGISIQGGIVTVTKGYSTRGCEQHEDFDFAEAILDAPDPVKAATIWGLDKRLSDAEYAATRAREVLAESEEALAKAKTDRAAYEG
jgi:hypothetical protein